MSRFLTVIAAGLLVLGSAGPATTTATDATGSDGVVRVVGTWEGPEAAAFGAVVEPFEARTGLQVEYVATRDPLRLFENEVAAGNPPDILALPSPSMLERLARDGELIDLAGVIDQSAYKRETAPAFLRLGIIDGRLYGVAFKGTVKGLMWFDRAVYTGHPQSSWGELQHAAALTVRDIAEKGGPALAPWCLALESAESTGWPGTDWVEDFLLRQSGPDTYDAWVAGELPWTSPEVAWAFQSFGLVVDATGEPEAAVDRHFSAAAEDLLGEPPRCLFLHQGSFMPDFFDAIGGDYEFMPFPDIDPQYAGALIGGGDLLALTDDTTGGRALIGYLVGAEAQGILVGQGGAVSGNLTVEDYPDPRSRRLAGMLADASIFRFDASDTMPPEVETAFRQAIVDYTLEPTRLEDILADVEALRTGAGDAA